MVEEVVVDEDGEEIGGDGGKIICGEEIGADGEIIVDEQESGGGGNREESGKEPPSVNLYYPNN